MPKSDHMMTIEYEKVSTGLSGACNGFVAGLFVGFCAFFVGAVLAFLIFPLFLCLVAPLSPFIGAYMGYQGVGRMTCPFCGKTKVFTDWYHHTSCRGCGTRFAINRMEQTLSCWSSTVISGFNTNGQFQP